MENKLNMEEYYSFPQQYEEYIDSLTDISNNKEIIDQTLYITYCLLVVFFFSEVFKNKDLRERLLWVFVVLYNKMTFVVSENEEKREIEEASQKPAIKYEDRYKDKIADLESFELTKERLDELKCAILMETTPLGNVILYYDNNREVFTYYSDSTIPYRFLETVARKYVVLHNCKSIFVDMEEEIKNAEKKLQEKKEQKKKEEEKQLQKADDSIPVRKSVFAKLKSYNKDSGLKVAGISGDSKNSGAKNTKTENEENMILKEKANRYSCEGKIMNFSFLKKVDRKVVDKRYAVSFAEFKKMHSGF